MKGNMFRKGLVVGIIVLFIGVGIQPAFANEVSITNKTSDVEEDCNCNPVSNLHLIRLERMLNRLEMHTKILSVFSKYNPEVAEKYQEISNRISTLKETNNELKLDSPFQYNLFMCIYLITLLISVGIAIEIVYGLAETFPALIPILYVIDKFLWDLELEVNYLLNYYDCIDFPPHE